MYDSPGSSIRYIVIDREVVLRKKAPLYFSRGDDGRVAHAINNDADDSVSTSVSESEGNEGSRVGFEDDNVSRETNSQQQFASR